MGRLFTWVRCYAAPAVLLIAVCTSAATAVQFTDLGPGTSTGITADGSVVSFNSGSNAYIWSFTDGAKDLGAGATAGVAIRNGSVVVGGNIGNNAWRWDGNTAGLGAWTQLPLCDGSKAWTVLCTVASDAKANTWFGGNSGTSPNAGACRYKQSSNSTTSLSLPSGGNNNSYILGMSDDGYYAGRCQYGGSGTGGARQAMGGSTLLFLNNLLGPPSTSNEAVANCMSRDHLRIGGWSWYEGGGSYHQAVIWWGLSWSSIIPIPFLPGTDYAETQALSGGGSVAGGFAAVATNISGTKRAWIWDSLLGTRDLAAVLTSMGADLTGWVLTDVKGISADGLILTGNGKLNGVEHAWVAVGPFSRGTVATCNRSAVRDAALASPGNTFLVTVFGKVLTTGYALEEYFTIDDGSGVPIRVNAPGNTIPPPTEFETYYARATGGMVRGSDPPVLNSTASLVYQY